MATRVALTHAVSHRRQFERSASPFAHSRFISNVRSNVPDLSIKLTEMKALDREDVVEFWRQRIRVRDPAARIGLALFGKPGEIAETIRNADNDALSYWRPNLTFSQRVLLVLSGIPTQTTTREDLVRYWTALAEHARERVLTQLGDDRRDEFGAIGLALARAHAREVSRDVARKLGCIPGLMSAEQLRVYHQEVFRSFGLPASTYGGTPLWFVPDAIELLVASSLYASGSDRRW